MNEPKALALSNADALSKDGSLSSDIKKFIAEKWESSNSERFPGPQPVSIERKHIPLLSKNPYLVCEKTDGVRNFLICFTDSIGRKICALVNRSFDYELYPLTLPRDTLLDGELLGKDYIIHDAVCIKGEDVRQKTLTERLAYARAVTKSILPLEKLKVKCKNMLEYKNMSQLVLGEHTDGVIFTPVNEPVRMGTHRTLFKWKPREKITVDFYLKNSVFHIQHDGKLVGVAKPLCASNLEGIFECSFEGAKWIPEKRRTDKSHPNNKRTYERTLVNIKENIKFCELVPGK
jgi:hypothetical protein